MTVSPIHHDLVARAKDITANPLVMAAAKATLSEACTLAAHADATARNGRLVEPAKRSSTGPAAPPTRCGSGLKGA